MFYSMDKFGKILVSHLVAVGSYFLFTVIFGLGQLMQVPNYATILRQLPVLWLPKCLISACIVVLLVWLENTGLNVEARQVGHGQHGSARWATEQEKQKMYLSVSNSKEKTPGIVIGRERNQWMVDTSDNNVLMPAPPGAGKTKRVFIPTIVYNALLNRNTGGEGASMILLDCKGELLRKCGKFLQTCGYRVLFLDFVEPLTSYCFNLMFNVNQYITQYQTIGTEYQKLVAYGRAERYAKILAASIIENMGEVQKSDSGSYFNETAKGLLTGMILLVSEYGQPNERHIISVFRLIIEMNGLTEESDQTVQKSRLQELLTYVENERIRNYVGPATSADVRTSMNVFSSALGKLVQFIDAELEPMVCNHSQELNNVDFIHRPTAIFLTCPDSNTTRHFFASLFIRYTMNDLIEQADANPSLCLDRNVLCLWDEFGNMPPIKDVDVLVSAARSRGIRFILSIQSYGQLEKNYSKQMAQIIKDCCQITMTTYVSPNSRATAEEISRTLGSKTIQSGSVSKGHGRTQSLQMIGRRLLTEDEIINLPQGVFIIMKSGHLPCQTKLPLFFEYLDVSEDFAERAAPVSLSIAWLTAEKIQSSMTTAKIKQGMFD